MDVFEDLVIAFGIVGLFQQPFEDAGGIVGIEYFGGVIFAKDTRGIVSIGNDQKTSAGLSGLL